MNHASLDRELFDRVTLIRSENYTLSIGFLTLRARTVF